MRNKIKSLIILLTMLLIATMTVGGKIQLNNIFQIGVTILLYIGILKFVVFAFKHIQIVSTEAENIVHKHLDKKKYKENY